MNNSGKWFHVIEAVLAVMVILMAAAMLLEKNSKQYRKISIIIYHICPVKFRKFQSANPLQ